MVRRIIYLIVVLFCVQPVFAQDWEDVKQNPIYLWGEGWGITVSEADNNALNDLVSKISIQVVGNVSQTEEEKFSNGDVESNTSFQAIIETYSQATLNNTERVIIKNEPDAHVGRWIKRSEINKIFEARENKAKEYIDTALKAEAKGKIDIALKDLFWALTLVQSLQYPNDVYYDTEEGGHFMVTKWIPEQIERILGELQISVVSRKDNDVELQMLFHGKPVSSLDYTYFDGRDWSNIYSAKDGSGVLELAPGNMADTYQLKIEYEYRSEAHIDKDVESVMTMAKSRLFRDAYIQVKSKQVKPKATATHKLSTTTNTVAFVAEDSVASYTQCLDKLLQSVTAKQYDNVSSLFTTNGLDIYNSLLKYGKAQLVGTPNYACFKVGETIVVRGVKMSFSFAGNNRKSFVEDLVFTFNDETKIDNISFGLGQVAENDILNKGVWSKEARLSIMQFLENYQTAYALKRLDYIETIFDDDAVIITGKVAYRPKETVESSAMYFDNKIVKYNRYDKQSYLRQLKRSFDSKEYINLRFANNDVRKMGKGGELYAIQISQEYYSSNYGDKGFLFLMIDINDPEKPIIKVRTWQPEKDPNFGYYGPEDFK